MHIHTICRQPTLADHMQTEVPPMQIYVKHGSQSQMCTAAAAWLVHCQHGSCAQKRASKVYSWGAVNAFLHPPHRRTQSWLRVLDLAGACLGTYHQSLSLYIFVIIAPSHTETS